jgi:hypothetical protein
MNLVFDHRDENSPFIPNVHLYQSTRRQIAEHSTLQACVSSCGQLVSPSHEMNVSVFFS